MLRKSIFVVMLLALLCSGFASSIVQAKPAAAPSADIFLKGQYIEVGVNKNGYFGSGDSAPVGYHPNVGTRLGFVADYQKDGWTTGTPPYGGDYFLPGSPAEGFTVTWNNSTLVTKTNINSLATDFTATSLTDTSSGTQHSATWVGTSGSGAEQVQITHDISFSDTDLALTIKSTIQNTGSGALQNLKFGRFVDPDNEQVATGSFTTTNQVIKQPGVGGDVDQAVVTAKGVTYPDMVLGMMTTDARAKVSASTNWSTDPGAVLSAPVAGPVTVDDSIELAYDLGTLNAGASVSVTYQYALATSAIGGDVTITYSSQAARDGWVLAANPLNKVGGSLNTKGNVRVGDDGLNRQYKGILSFDTSGIPAGATIKSAELRLHGGASSSAGKNLFSLLGNLLVDVRKGAFGSNALQLSDFQAAPSAKKVGSFGLGLPTVIGGLWYSAGLNSTGMADINRTGITQFRVYFTKPTNLNHLDNYMNFSGGENASFAPELVVTYSLP